MNDAIWLAVIAIVSAPIGSALTAILMRRKHNTEIKKLQAEVQRVKAEVRSSELENVRKGNEIIMEQIVKPLETQIKRLNATMGKLEKAVGQIPSCPYSADCPVTDELRSHEKGGERDVFTKTGDSGNGKAGKNRKRGTSAGGENLGEHPEND